MAADIQAEDASKRERIINAIASYPGRYEFDAEIVAELADASESYVYRIQREIEADELEESQFEDDLDDELQQQYRDRIGDLLDERDVERTIDEEAKAQPGQEDEQAAPSEEAASTEDATSGGQELVQDAAKQGVPVAQIQSVRDQLDIIRREAEYGRENFQEEAVDVAHGKYYVANHAIELLDELIEDG